MVCWLTMSSLGYLQPHAINTSYHNISNHPQGIDEGEGLKPTYENMGPVSVCWGGGPKMNILGGGGLLFFFN